MGQTYRASLIPLINLLDGEEIKTTEKHWEELKKTNFWYFIKPIKDGKLQSKDCFKSNIALKYIIEHYKPDEKPRRSGNVFNIGGKDLESHPNYVSLIFGMKRIKMTTEEKEKFKQTLDETLKDRTMEKELKASDLYCYIKYIVPEKIRVRKNTQCPPTTIDLNEKEEKNMNKKENKGAKKEGENSEIKLMKDEILDAIKEVVREDNREEDFVRLLVLYMCCTTFFPIVNGSYINYKFLQCVESIDVINKISWPDMIHEVLMESVAENYKKKPKSVLGCTMYLLYWAFHFTGFAPDTSESEERYCPRFIMWNLNKTSSALGRKFSGEQSNLRINSVCMEARNADAVEQTLISLDNFDDMTELDPMHDEQQQIASPQKYMRSFELESASELAQKDDKIAELEALYNELKNVLAEKDERNSHLESDMVQKDVKFAELEALYCELKNVVAEKDKRISVLESNLAQQDVKFAELKIILEVKEERIFDLECVLAQKHDHGPNFEMGSEEYSRSEKTLGTSKDFEDHSTQILQSKVSREHTTEMPVQGTGLPQLVGRVQNLRIRAQNMVKTIGNVGSQQSTQAPIPFNDGIPNNTPGSL